MNNFLLTLCLALCLLPACFLVSEQTNRNQLTVTRP